MTSREARQQVDACENRIVGTYSQLIDTARGMGSSAVQAASKKTGGAVVALLISVIGVVLWIADHPGWGLLVIAAGIVVAYSVSQSVDGKVKKIESQQKNLFSTIDNNSKI